MVYHTFLTFHISKYKLMNVSYTVIVVALILFLLILQVNYHYYHIAILSCLGLTFFILWRLFHPLFEVSKEYESDKIKKEMTFTFKFYDKFFTVEDTKEISKVKYYKLYHIFETSNFFYLYLDKKHAFLIDKSQFKKGNPFDFSSFIKKKCWWNFKKVK